MQCANTKLVDYSRYSRYCTTKKWQVQAANATVESKTSFLYPLSSLFTRLADIINFLTQTTTVLALAT